LVNQSVRQSVSQLISQSVNQSVSSAWPSRQHRMSCLPYQPSHYCACTTIAFAIAVTVVSHKVTRLIVVLVNQSVRKSVSQLISQSANQSVSSTQPSRRHRTSRLPYWPSHHCACTTIAYSVVVTVVLHKVDCCVGRSVSQAISLSIDQSVS